MVEAFICHKNDYEFPLIGSSRFLPMVLPKIRQAKAFSNQQILAGTPFWKSVNMSTELTASLVETTAIQNQSNSKTTDPGTDLMP